MATIETSLPYHEPDIATILIISSLLLSANIVNWILDRLVYCGLLGQILIGIAWGTPGAKWLDANSEAAIVKLGYVGLLLLVYEGGLTTSYKALKANLLLSIVVATTGIVLPVGLSYALGGIAGTNSLQSFVAGAALCSTSLGTTFTVIRTTGLLKTRLGVILTSAAMLDDVVGLVMVQVISNLGGSTTDISAGTIIRPILVSLGFMVLSPLLCWLAIKPITLGLNNARAKNKDSKLNWILTRKQTAFVFHTILLLSMIAGASYAGTSNLFAAYLAGAIVNWWDNEVPHDLSCPSDPIAIAEPLQNQANPSESAASDAFEPSTGLKVFESYYLPANEVILKPFFFASIGFSIPLVRLFDSSTVWKGIVYAILMLFGKLACGLWLIRVSISLPWLHVLRKNSRSLVQTCRSCLWCGGVTHTVTRQSDGDNQQAGAKSGSEPFAKRRTGGIKDQVPGTPAQEGNATVQANHSTTISSKNSISLYPGAILGLAMVSRGEIGFLISSLAESQGLFLIDGNDQPFLIVTWAIVLCTALGPIGVGLLVRRVKRLEKMSQEQRDGRDILGVWGVA